MRQPSRRKVAAGLLLSFFGTGSTAFSWDSKPPSTDRLLDTNTHEFTLRHIFHRGTYQDPYLHKRLDVRPGAEFIAVTEGQEVEDVPPPRLIARSNPIHIERLSDRRHSKIEEHLEYAGLTGSPRILDTSEWTTDEVPGPNVTDKATVVNLAIMAANAYVPKYGEGEWEDVGLGFNKSASFGWEGDGLRGHIFADEGNKTIVVALKGTSPAVFDGDGTTTRDKLNDNLFFSCCCAQGGQFFWRQVCDCYSSTYTCNSTCLVKSLKQKTRYYTAATELYTNVTAMYPDSEVWIVGHSLGGAVSSLLGLTFGHPVVTYEAPGDDLAARRLGLPVARHADPFHPHQRANTGSVHFGHTADPIFMGVCNGATSPCTLGGYAMESQCHTGTQCVYDTVSDLGWRVGLGYHRIHDVIDNVIRKYDAVPPCIPDSECFDCYNWKYFESNGSDSKTSTTMTSTTTTRTRSTTCKTPGWWGCLDPTTTSSAPVITTTYTTTTCLTPGWFGCKKEGNTTITTITTIPTTSVTTTTTTKSHSTSCETPGWLGCNDPTTTSRVTATQTSTTTATSCKTPGFFWGCYDEPTTTTIMTHTITSPPTVTPTSIDSSQITSSTRKTKNPRKGKCKHPALFGLICLDSHDGSDSALVAQDELDLEL